MQLDAPANVLDFGGSNGGFPLLLASEGVRLKRVVSVEANPSKRNLDCEVISPR